MGFDGVYWGCVAEDRLYWGRMAADRLYWGRMAADRHKLRHRLNTVFKSSNFVAGRETPDCRCNLPHFSRRPVLRAVC